MQRRDRSVDSGWVYNTPPVRESVTSPPTPGPSADPLAAVGLALAAIEAAIDCYGPHSDPLGIHLQEVRAQVHAALQALRPV
jgi:hypothetical protein